MARGYVLLDSNWARLLGVWQSSGGMYRIGRRELRERLEQLQQAPRERVVRLSAVEGGRGLIRSTPWLDNIVAWESHPHFVEFY